MKKSFLQNLILLVVIPVPVIFVFRTLDRELATVIAGLLFCVAAASQLFFAQKTRRVFGSLLKSASFLSGILFILAAVIPLIGTRIVYWGLPFKTLSFLGIPLTKVHMISDGLYLLMIISSIADFYRISAAWNKNQNTNGPNLK